jgi:hypothetical protein
VSINELISLSKTKKSNPSIGILENGMPKKTSSGINFYYARIKVGI